MALELGGAGAAAAYVGAALASAVYVGGELVWPEPTEEFDTQTVANGSWDDPATWSSGVPGVGDTVLVEHAVSHDQNIIVQGTANEYAGGVELLAMRPGAELQFLGVTENYTGGGTFLPCGTSIPSDQVGLWVVCDGQLDWQGTPKKAWTRLVGGAAAGATTIAVQDATGWQVGDRIVIVPTEHPRVGSRSYTGFETRFISAINGNDVSFITGLSHAHPSVTDPFTGVVHTAEVLNLTRDVVISGTGDGSADPASNGRAHILIQNSVPIVHTIEYVELVLLGPRQDDPNQDTESVTGRYPLHFHMNGESVRGTFVEGVVVRNAGNRAFVPHASHGITFRDTIAYDVWEEPYWWDQPDQGDTGPNPNATDDVLYDRTVAALVKEDPPFRGFRMGAYVLTAGANPEVRDSVAVGVLGNRQSSGFEWPENGHAEWVFNQGNVAHNNKVNGIFGWQNDSLEHVIEDFVAYHNGQHGIEHGAYNNMYQYIDVRIFGNAGDGLNLHALPRDDGDFRTDGYDLAFENYHADGPMETAKHNLAPQNEVLFKDCTFTEIRIIETGEGPQNPGEYDFVNCVDFDDGEPFEPQDVNLIAPLSGMVIRAQDPDCTAWRMDDTGAVTTIEAFYPCSAEPDEEAPTQPQNVVATPVSDSQIDLSWDASTDNVGVTAYRVYRDTVQIDEVGETSYSDTGLTAETTYTYEISALDFTGNESVLSEPAQATTLAEGAGPTPVFTWDGPQTFDGVDDFVDVSPFDPPTAALTIATRFTADDFEGDARVFSKATGIQAADHWLMIGEREGQLRVRLKAGGTTTTLIGGSLSAGVSHHGAATYDGATLRLYLDGVEVATASVSGAVDTDSNVDAWVGANPDATNWFDGLIEHVHVYDRALSASEIAALVGS